VKAAVPLLLVAVLAVGGCADRKEKYCDEVRSQQAPLGEALGSGNDAFIKALPVFTKLRDRAPDDIRDEWDTVIKAVERLRDALDAAGVDPATYDRDQPPAGLAQDDKDAIDAAARGLSDPTTVAAFDGVQQQARDVCGTPLTI
jgi:hypothetical protein